MGLKSQISFAPKSMSNTIPKTLSASKRARSQESKRSLNPSPVQKAPKVEEAVEDAPAIVPHFLHLSNEDIASKFEDLNWQEQMRIAKGRNDMESPWVQDQTTPTKLRNRYANVQPWEKSRIRLKVGEGQSDYINASPISLKDPNQSREWAYIATQGPKDTDFDHFWQMVWHESTEVAVIVMLTQTSEAGREKCFQYFPLEPQAGPLTVQPSPHEKGSPPGTVEMVNAYLDEGARTTVRQLKLQFGEESKTVWHLLFEAWPDFSIPQGDDKAALLQLIKLSTEKQASPNDRRFVHCSAGVGRSGTFIALEYLLAQVENGSLEGVPDEVDIIYDTVNALREQRMTMVQALPQYLFLYQVILEQYKSWQLHYKSVVENSQRMKKVSTDVHGHYLLRKSDPIADEETFQSEA